MQPNQEFYDGIAGRYHTLRYGRTYHRKSAELELEYLAPHLAAGDYLEVGPGTGRVTELLLRHVRSLMAVDLSEQMLEQLRARLGDTPRLRTRQMEIGSLSSLEGYGTFDGCVSMRVLPHIPDLPGALAALAGAVRPGGRVIFDLWNAWGYDGVGKRLKLRPTRVYTRYHSRGAMRRAIGAAGLRVVDSRGFGYLPFEPFLAADRTNPPLVSFFAQRVLWICEASGSGRA